MSFLGSIRRGFKSLFGTFGGFEGALGNRRMRNFQPLRAHVNTLISAAGPDLIARARHLVRNNGYAANAVEAFAASVVGTGFTPASSVKSKGASKRIHEVWDTWIDDADLDGLSDIHGLLRRGAKEVFVGGEAFIRRVYVDPADAQEEDLEVPMRLQVLPSEMLPLYLSEQAANGNMIRQGVEFNERGRRVAFHFWRKNPADSTDMRPVGETVRVPAEDVIHLIDPSDAGQIRGVTRYAAAIVKLFLLDSYDDAELDRKKVAAMYALFIETPDADFYPTGTGLDVDEDGAPLPSAPTAADRTLDLQPGMIAQLEPGEKISSSAPTEVGVTYEPFQYRTLLQVSAALGIPYAILTNDVMRANYSNVRAAMVEFRRRVETFQHTVMVYQACDRIWGWVMDVAVLANVLTLADYGRRRKEHQRVTWMPPKFDWVDPWKDAKAEVVQIEAGLKSRSQAIRERGMDPLLVDQEIADDRKRERQLGITFTQDPQKVTGDPAVDGGPENVSPDGGPAGGGSGQQQNQKEAA